MDDLYFFRREEDVGHVVVMQDVAVLEWSSLLEYSIDDRDGGWEELLIFMVWHDADDRRRVLKRLGEDISEEVNGVSEDVGIVAYENQLIFEHHEGPYVEEGIEGEHAEHWVDPIPNEEGLSLVPITHEGYILLVDQPQFILLIEIDLLGLKISVAVIKQFRHPFHLELAVSLLDGEFDVLFVMLVDGQPFHLHIINQVPQDFLVEGEEWEVWHYAEHSLRDTDLQVAYVLAVVDGLRWTFVGERNLMALTLDDWLFGQGGAGTALNDAKRDVVLVVLALNPGVVVDADTYAK